MRKYVYSGRVFGPELVEIIDLNCFGGPSDIVIKGSDELVRAVQHPVRGDSGYWAELVPAEVYAEEEQQ